MATWYNPLVLPAQLAALPQGYQTSIPLYEATGSITASQNIDKMNDYCDRNEIADETIKLRLFAQSLGGEVRKWFKNLAPHSIQDLHAFHQLFLNKWEVRKNPLQTLSEYENIKRNAGEGVQEYCARYNSIYNALPAHMKPPQGLALMKFPVGFDPEMAY